MDVVYVGLIVLFFASCAGLVRFCAARMTQGRRS
jgi:hypothetical protein